MELRLLHYFSVVCEAGSLHAAADIVRVAQPSLSRQIRRLEQQLGFALFDRTPRGLSLTQAGRSFLPVAEDLLVRSERAGSAARTIAQGAVSGLTVVAATTTVSDIVAPFVAEAGAHGVIGNAMEASPELVYGHLSRGEADFAISTLAPPKELRWKVLGRAYIWAMMPPEHVLSRKTSIAMEDLVQEPLLVMNREHRAREIFDVAVSNAGLSYTLAVEVSAASLAQALAAAGRGIAILSDDPRFGLRTVPILSGTEDLSLTLYGVWDGSHYATRTIDSCLEALASFNQRVYPAINPVSARDLRGLAPV